MLRYHVAMSNTPVSSPDEVIALRAKVSEQAAEIEHLKLLIAKLRRMQFGRSSEQMNEMLGQLELSLEELETLRAETPADPTTPADTREAPRPAIRSPIICPATSRSTCLRRATAQPVAPRSRSWARPSARCSSTCRRASG